MPETLLPLHLNLMVDTVIAEDETLVPLHQALNGTARQVSQTVLEVNPSDAELKPELLFAGLHRLRQLGYRVALDGAGAGNCPLTVIAEARPELIKMDREIVAGLPGDSSCVAVLEALQHLAGRIGAAAVAHIGADDFVVITDPEDVMPLGSGVLDEPWEVDGCEVTLSLASLICSPGTVAGPRDVSRMLARLHRHAKSMPATSWVSGRTSSDRVEVVRGDARVAPVA